MGLDAMKIQAVEFLATEGKRLGSILLISTALKLGPDPFKKVKTLIQGLIERLLQEMADEAGHKGFCDTELGKAKSQRDFKHQDSVDLSAKLDELEVKKAELEELIVTLTGDLKDLNEALEKATKLRGEEKEENSESIKSAAEGAEAVKEAIGILKDFYAGAAKAFVQVGASPIDEKGGVGAGGQAQGSYKGNQDQGGSIIGMLEVIMSDFERAVKKTSDAEAESHRLFVLFDRQSKGSISAKETGKAQAEADLKETDIGIHEAMTSLGETQKLLDDALKAIEELKPACIDTGMSYAERVAAREKEIEALK